MLWRALHTVRDGFYIDVGAADPNDLSVTRLFYDHGWNGMNFEPNPTYFSRLQQQRPRDINLSVGVGADRGAMIINIVEGSGLSSFSNEITDRYRSNWQVTEREVEIVTLAEACQRFRPEGPIHFLKVDVEGFEEQVLLGADFQRFRPWIVLVEATVPGSPVQAYESWDPILTGQNYRFVWFDGLNRFYVANEKYDELVGFFTVQPNVFDHFHTLQEMTKQYEDTKMAMLEMQNQKLHMDTKVAESMKRATELLQNMQNSLAQQVDYANGLQKRCEDLENRLQAAHAGKPVARSALTHGGNVAEADMSPDTARLWKQVTGHGTL